MRRSRFSGLIRFAHVVRKIELIRFAQVHVSDLALRQRFVAKEHSCPSISLSPSSTVATVVVKLRFGLTPSSVPNVRRADKTIKSVG